MMMSRRAKHGQPEVPEAQKRAAPAAAAQDSAGVVVNSWPDWRQMHNDRTPGYDEPTLDGKKETSDGSRMRREDTRMDELCESKRID
jgi:hypothetical protein